MDGLPSIDETFINVKLNPSVAYGTDLSFLFPDYINGKIIPLGRMQLQGTFLGFTNDFVANGDFDTNLGHISSDINYKIQEGNVGLSSYRGNLSLTNFHLGQFFKDTVNFQQVNLKGNINGKGFSKENADFILNGEISSIGILRYRS